MDLSDEISKKIEKKRSELVALESQAAACKAYIEGQEEILKLMNRGSSKKDPSTGKKGASRLRQGTLKEIYNYLKDTGHAQYVDDILQGINKEANADNRKNISSQLNRYVLKDEIFTRPEPNTYGLKEFSDVPSDATIQTKPSVPPPPSTESPSAEDDLPF